MKGKGLFCTVVAAGFLSAGVSSALAQYSSIQHNLNDGISDLAYDAGTGLLQVDSGSNLLTLNDSLNPTGMVSNTSIHLETTFAGLDGTTAEFTGGSLSLAFDFDEGGGPVSYNIGGPIAGMEFDITILVPGAVSRIDGEGLFDATSVSLPGSGNWPAAELSSIDTLTLVFGIDLGGFDWSTDIDPVSGTIETTYSLFPDNRAVPEPVSLLLLGVCSAGVLIRRRRA